MADEVNAVAHLLHGFVGVILPEARVVLVPVLLLLVVGRVRVNIDLGVAAAAEDLVRLASCSSSAWRFRR